jgi:hypothetical protein
VKTSFGAPEKKRTKSCKQGRSPPRRPSRRRCRCWPLAGWPSFAERYVAVGSTAFPGCACTGWKAGATTTRSYRLRLLLHATAPTRYSQAIAPMR